MLRTFFKPKTSFLVAVLLLIKQQSWSTDLCHKSTRSSYYDQRHFHLSLCQNNFQMSNRYFCNENSEHLFFRCTDTDNQWQRYSFSFIECYTSGFFLENAGTVFTMQLRNMYKKILWLSPQRKLKEKE